MAQSSEIAAHFKIRAQEVRQAQSLTFDFPISVALFQQLLSDSECHATAPGKLKVHAQGAGNDILLTLTLSTTLTIPCARCLDPLEADVSFNETVVMVPKVGAVAIEESDVDPDEPDRELYDGETIVLDELVRDYLLLELPLEAKHPLAACNPDMVKHISNASTPATDTRLAGLAAIKEQLFGASKEGK